MRLVADEEVTQVEERWFVNEFRVHLEAPSLEAAIDMFQAVQDAIIEALPPDVAWTVELNKDPHEVTDEEET